MRMKKKYGIAKKDTEGNRTRRMRIVLQIRNQNVLTFIAFPLQQCFHELATLLLYTYID